LIHKGKKHLQGQKETFSFFHYIPGSVFSAPWVVVTVQATQHYQCITILQVAVLSKPEVQQHTIPFPQT